MEASDLMPLLYGGGDKMFDKIKRLFAMKGTWEWACKQMESGKIVRPQSATGSVHYRLDLYNQRKIQWCFGTKELPPEHPAQEWKNAIIFLNTFETNDWIIFEQ